MGRSRLRSAVFSWPAAAVAVIVLQGILSSVLKPGQTLSSYTLIPYFILLVLATVIASVNALQRTLGQRPFWAFLAVGFGLWALDSWLWIYYELILRQKIPDSSIADPALFLHVVPFLAALATRPELGEASLRRHQTTLNFLLLLLFWVFLYAFLVFPFQFLPANSTIYNLRYDVLYFGENLALIATLGALLLRADAPWKSLYWHMLGATGVYVTASLIANTAIDLGGYYPGHWTDFVILIAICWFVWIPLRARQLEPPTRSYVETKAAGLQGTTVLAMLVVLMIPGMSAWDLSQTEDWWMHRIRILVGLCFMTLLALAILLTVSWRLTLLVLCIVPLNVVLIDWVGRKLKRRSRRAQEGMADMTASLEETIAGVRVVKAFGTRAREQERFGRQSYRHMMHYIKMQMYGALSAPTSELLGTVSFAVVLWYGGQRVIDGGLPAENLVMFVAAMLFVVSPLKNLSRLSTVVSQATASAQRVFDLLDVAKEHSGEGTRTATFADEVRFESVSFEYVAGESVLRDVTFSARKGEVVAIVGSSGAGKTTLVDLIPRFYTPTSGRICIDGVDTRECSLSSLRALMGIVTQETILFNDSIYNNIAYGSPNATAEAIESAARAANAHEFVTGFPGGYDTVVGDRGAQLSGGQRQRIAIARAILRDPAILIFDEATSALDSESERLVQEAMDRLFAGRTTFVIAHRLSTIRHADKILVLDRGRLTEHGTHSELMTQNGVYHRLYQLQFGHAGA